MVYYMKDKIFQISGILILFSAILYMFSPDIAPWIMSVSVLIFSLITMTNPYPGKSIRGKRLFNFQLFSCLLMIASTYLMFKHRPEWPLVMIIGAILMLYAVIAIPKELNNEKDAHK